MHTTALDQKAIYNTENFKFAEKVTCLYIHYPTYSLYSWQLYNVALIWLVPSGMDMNYIRTCVPVNLSNLAT